MRHPGRHQKRQKRYGHGSAVKTPCAGGRHLYHKSGKSGTGEMGFQHVVHECHSRAKAVVVNSGVANACTGQEGYGYCQETAKKAAELLDVSADEILVASTGVIGRQLPMDKIMTGVEHHGAYGCQMLWKQARMAAEAIMTTDTDQKRSGSGSRNRRKDGYHRRYVQGLRHDSSQHVYHAVRF